MAVEAVAEDWDAWMVAAVVVAAGDRNDDSRDDQAKAVHDEVTNTWMERMDEAGDAGPWKCVGGKSSVVVVEAGGRSSHDAAGMAEVEEVVHDENMQDGEGRPVGSSHNGWLAVVVAADGAPPSSLAAGTALPNVQGC